MSDAELTLEKLRKVRDHLKGLVPADRPMLVPNVPYLVNFCEEHGLRYQVISPLEFYQSDSEDDPSNKPF